MKNNNVAEVTMSSHYPIIGKSRAVDNVRKLIAKLARTRNDIVIIGEDGVGKGAIAKNIHYQNSNGENELPFVRKGEYLR